MMKGQLAGLMKQAQQMQENMRKMQEQLATVEVEGQSGAGLVKVLMTCKHDVKRVTIDPSLLGEDKDMLEAEQKIIDGGDVLVAIFREEESHALYLLQQQDATRGDLLRFISHGVRKEDNDEEVEEAGGAGGDGETLQGMAQGGAGLGQERVGQEHRGGSAGSRG